eukprot:m.57910 g.57910  ORF g.57910 m.57910 type:complete len:297 (-) comp22465_c0_seq1:164-1054(-)
MIHSLGLGVWSTMPSRNVNMSPNSYCCLLWGLNLYLSVTSSGTHGNMAWAAVPANGVGSLTASPQTTPGSSPIYQRLTVVGTNVGNTPIQISSVSISFNYDFDSNGYSAALTNRCDQTSVPGVWYNWSSFKISSCGFGATPNRPTDGTITTSPIVFDLEFPVSILPGVAPINVYWKEGSPTTSEHVTTSQTTDFNTTLFVTKGLPPKFVVTAFNAYASVISCGDYATLTWQATSQGGSATLYADHSTIVSQVTFPYGSYTTGALTNTTVFTLQSISDVGVSIVSATRQVTVFVKPC